MEYTENTLASPSRRSLKRKAISSFVSGDILCRIAYRCYAVYFKTSGSSLLSENAISMLWISLRIDLYPELMRLPEQLDVELVCNLYLYLRVGPYTLNWTFYRLQLSSELLPLIQRHKKRSESPVASVNDGM